MRLGDVFIRGMISGRIYFTEDAGIKRFTATLRLVKQGTKENRFCWVDSRFLILCNLVNTGMSPRRSALIMLEAFLNTNSSTQEPNKNRTTPAARMKVPATNSSPPKVFTKNALLFTQGRYQRQPEPIVKVCRKSTFFLTTEARHTLTTSDPYALGCASSYAFRSRSTVTCV